MRQLTNLARKGKAIAVAVAAAIGVASTAANALNLPAYGTAAPPQGTGLVLAIWDGSTGNATSGHGEQVNLGYLYSDLAPVSSSALTPNSQTAPFTLATNPASGTGSVFQLNFGTVPQFAATFGTGATSSYMVVTADGTPSTGTAADYTYVNGTFPATFVQSDLGTIIASIGGQAWSGTQGFTIDTTGTGAANPLAGTFAGGTLGENANFSGAVGSALEFFNTVPGSGRGSAPSTNAFANAAGAGFWFLSSAGDLTWNVLAGTQTPVPLPAAVWLFASGLAGLGAIGRRRRAAAA